MFWGLEMEPAKVYKQKVEKAFHVSMACLQPNKCADSNFTSLILRKDDKDFVLCNLQKDKVIQVQLDLMFGSGDEIAFTLTGGKNKIYLSGYILDEDDPDQMFNESDSEDGDQIEMEEEIPTLVEGKRKSEPSPFESTNKKAKLQQEQSDEDSDESDDLEEANEEDSDEEDSSDDEQEEDEEEGESGTDSDESDYDKETTSTKVAKAKTPDKGKNKSPVVQQQQFKEKMHQKTPVRTPDSQLNGITPKSKKKNKGGADTDTPKGKKTPDSPKDTTPNKMKLEGGVLAIDTKVGTGPAAKPGKRIAVYYTGRLQKTNKQFDASLQGKGFVFQLGRGEVIKGWDIGVAGMKVGGKRKITVPAPLAYGSKGSPPVIPPNSTLEFDVELKNVY